MWDRHAITKPPPPQLLLHLLLLSSLMKYFLRILKRQLFYKSLFRLEKKKKKSIQTKKKEKEPDSYMCVRLFVNLSLCQSPYVNCSFLVPVCIPLLSTVSTSLHLAPSTTKELRCKKWRRGGISTSAPHGCLGLCLAVLYFMEGDSVPNVM